MYMAIGKKKILFLLFSLQEERKHQAKSKLEMWEWTGNYNFLCHSIGIVCAPYKSKVQWKNTTNISNLTSNEPCIHPRVKI